MGGKELIRCLSSYAPHAAFPRARRRLLITRASSADLAREFFGKGSLSDEVLSDGFLSFFDGLA